MARSSDPTGSPRPPTGGDTRSHGPAMSMRSPQGWGLRAPGGRLSAAKRDGFSELEDAEIEAMEAAVREAIPG